MVKYWDVLIFYFARQDIQIHFCQKTVVFLFKFHCKVFPRSELINQHWFIDYGMAEQAPSHYLIQWWHSLLTQMWVTRPRWIKCYRKTFSISRTKSQNFNVSCVLLSWSLPNQSLPTGDAPTTSELSTILLPTKVRLILEVLRYLGYWRNHIDDLLKDCSTSSVLVWKRIGVIMCITSAPPKSYVRLINVTEVL